MDSRLFEAAIAGNISTLNQLIAQNPLILADSALIFPHENPLHIALKAGQLGSARQRRDGRSTIHYAAINGRDGRSTIHYAAINDKAEVMEELISSWAECFKDVTALGETVLHLTVKYHKFEAFRKSMEWLETNGLEELVNLGDEDGNTVLHIAVLRKQHEYVQLLLSNGTIARKLEVNAKNKVGLTEMDVMDKLIVENPSNIHLGETLQHASASTTTSPPTLSTQHVAQERDSPSDTRNVLLVVAALIATVTFEAGVNTPNGFIKNNTENSATIIAPPSLYPSIVRPPRSFEPQATATAAGLSVFFASLGSAQPAEESFLFGNSLGLASSICVIIYLTSGFPFQRELHISMYSMLFAYGWSIQDIDSKSKTVRHILMGSAFVLPFLLRWLPTWAKTIWRSYDKKTLEQPHA
ncbi:ankyrin repeat-containing protein BDA1-like [Ziziphus jujuba]|uniref:Ankyrin repeat-containing protein BDA1-like n=1 Tax=Ziziphus jujuba TaxID=326968 RepID=A0ABM4A9C3_ZIZJJ|nr:ankyrin repeat-containing protein BDA1-like [Ziziphus jujuba]